MYKLIEAIVGLIKVCFEVIFSFVAFLFGGTFNKNAQFNAGYMPFFKRIILLNRYNGSISADGKRSLNSKDTTHSLIIGKSGIGKSSVNFVPSILRAKSSFIVTDVDGDIFNKTSGYLKTQGFDIQVLNLKDVYSSEFYNPIAFCKTDSDLKKLAKSIIATSYPDAKRGSQGFWNTGAESIIYVFLRLLHQQPKEVQTFHNLRRLLKNITAADHFVSTNASDEIFEDYQAFTNTDLKIVSGMTSSALTALDGMGEKDLIHLTSKNTLDLGRLSKNKACLYIIIPEVKMMQYRFLTSILYSQIFDFYQLNKPSQKINIFMDEFGIQRIPDFPSTINVVRRYGLSVHMAVQSLKQIHQAYTAEGASVIINGGVSSKIIYPGMSLELARDLSMTMGKKSYQVKEGKYKRTVNRELLSVQELIQMENRSILLHKSLPPLIMRPVPYFKQRKLRQRTKLKPVSLPVNQYEKPKLISFSVNANPFDNEK